MIGDKEKKTGGFTYHWKIKAMVWACFCHYVIKLNHFAPLKLLNRPKRPTNAKVIEKRQGTILKV